jgi:putative ABC transport system permease protein
MRLVRQLLTETVLLALLGGAASVIVTRWVPPLLITAVPEMPMSPHVDLTPNLAILTYAFLASLVAAVACGLAPTLQASKPAIVTTLKEKGTPLSAGLGRLRLRRWLIVAQIAGCSVLLVAAGLLVRGLHRAQSTSPGFITKNVILVSLDLANKGYDEARAAAFERALRDRLATVPGVTGVARSGVVPCVASNVTSVTIPGSKADSSSLPVWENIVSANYFQTMGIPLLRGRTFTEQEAQAPGAVPAIISAAMARRFWGETDPVGKEFLSGTKTFQVLGIVPDVQNVHLGQTDGPFFYGASAPDGALDAKILVHTTGDSSVLEAEVPQLARQLDANVMALTETFDHALEKILMPSRTLALLVAVLGILAMILAVVGVCGIVAYAASQRTHEIGIRKALGAHPRDILTLLLRQEVKLAAVGLAIGLVVGAGAAQLLFAAGLLFGLSALDPTTYLVTAIAFISVTMLACYFPARRAMVVDPMVALRYD